jgi:PAS domain S-box-containing protein
MAGFRFNVRRRNVKGNPPTTGPDAPPDSRPHTENMPAATASTLVDCIPCPALIVTPDRHIDALNEPFCDAFGIKAAFFHIGEEFADFARRTSLTGSPGLIALGNLLPGDSLRSPTEIVAKNGNLLVARACLTDDGKTLITLASPAPGSEDTVGSLANNIVENMPGAVLCLTQTSEGVIRCLYASNQSATLFGRSLSEITGPDTDFRDFIAANHRATFDAMTGQTVSRSDTLDLEFQIVEPTLAQRWVRCIGNATPGIDGNAVFYVRLLDIEDRQRVADERQRLEKLLHLVVDNIPAIVSVRDATDDSYIIVNRAFEELTGHNREDVVGRSDIRLFQEIDNIERDRRTRERIGSGRLVELPEIRVKTPTRGYRFLKTRKCPLFDDAGKVRYVLAISDDITEHRKAEHALQESQQRFRDAIESLTDGIALFDAEERLLLCNRRYRDMWPGFEAVALPGVTFELLVRHNLETAARHGKNVDIESEVASRMMRYRNPPSTGEVPVFDGRWLQVTDRQTADGGVVVTCTDITPLKEREAGLKRASQIALHAKEAAEGANRSKSDFLANMSHELRTPLNAVIGFSEIIKDAMLGDDSIDQYRGYAKDIHDSGRHLLDLINDILDMSKIEAGKLDLAEEPVDLINVIDSSIRLVQERAQQGNVEIVVDTPTELPRFTGDLRKVKQITINLLSNAVKFTPEGGRVTASAFVGDDGDLTLRIGDTGIGIAPADLEKVMEPFGQADGGLDRQFEGTGLGLTLTRALTELHGGKLQIESNVNGPTTGTTVTANFPASRIID